MRKNIIYNFSRIMLLSLMAAAFMFSAQSCEEGVPGEYKIAEGQPEVYYARMPDPVSADSLIVGAFMNNTICLIGDNLNSIKELFFNDQKAVLNNSLITKNTLFVNIPGDIPQVVTNKIYMVSGSGDTVAYDFNVLVPAPNVASISCEYAHDGDVAILYGDYFIDDPSKPLSITMAGNVPVTEITTISKKKVTFIVPEGAQKGYINVTSIYGTSRSKFQFRDDRGMILDWDNLNANGGWRAGVVKESDPVEGISGKYVYFSGEIPGDMSDWNEDGFSFDLWGTANGRPEGDLFDIPVDEALLKFEVNVLSAWSGNALQMIFTPWSTSGTNGYIADGETPRGLWYPWLGDGSYTTDGWVTVSFPLKDFKYDHEGNTLEVAPVGNYGGLTFFVFHGGVTGSASSPQICIDNIRVVPAE
ncbi:MAG: glycan-binding surface protein [Prolixibacteraceae bacterium]|jgi:hypothetical protein|nr:glycan-binding surface protein [Prolixibacteraceae bacterium]